MRPFCPQSRAVTRRRTPTCNVAREDGSPCPRGLGGAFQPLLQALLILRNLLARPTAGERHEQLSEPMAFEVEHERHPRTRATVDRLERDPPGRSDRAVDSVESEYARRIVLGDLVADSHLALAHASHLGAFRASLGRPVAVLLGADNLRLPL